MEDNPKDVTLKELVSSVVESSLMDLKGKIDWEKAWFSIWEQLVDEAGEFGIFVADNTKPKFPPMLKAAKGEMKAEVKKALLQILEARLKK